MPQFTLNGKKYFSKRPIVPGLVGVSGESFRLEGTTRRIDNRKLTPFIYPWNRGFGFREIQRDCSECGRSHGLGGFLWANLDTRFGQLQRQLVATDISQTGNEDHFVKGLNYNGNWWGIFEKDYNAGNNGLILGRDFSASGDDWEGGGDGPTTDQNADGVRCFDAVVHKDQVYLLVSARLPDGSTGTSAEGRYSLVLTSDFSTYATATGTSWAAGGFGGAYISTTVARRNNFDDDMGKLVDVGDMLIIAAYEDPDSGGGTISQISVESTVDKGANMVLQATIPSNDGPRAAVLWFDRAGTPRPVIVTAENVYSIDTDNQSYEALLPGGMLTGDPHDGRRSVVGADGNLYVPKGDGNMLKLSLGPEIAGGVHAIFWANIGPATKRLPGHEYFAGVPSAYAGHFNYLTGDDPDFLYGTYGGHDSGSTAVILAYDYVQDAWHNVKVHDAANEDLHFIGISHEDDDVKRLFYAHEGSSASVTRHLEHYNVPSSVQSGQSYDTTVAQYIDFPDDDYGDPHTNVTAFVVRGDAENLDTKATNDSKITVTYGANRAAWDATAAGVLYSDALSLAQGTSGRGVAAKRIRWRLAFAGTAADDIRLSEFEVAGRTKQTKLNRYVVVIDLKKTAKYFNGSVATVMSNLKTAIELDPAMPFKAETTYGERQVEIVSMGDSYWKMLSNPIRAGTALGGEITLILEEVVQGS